MRNAKYNIRLIGGRRVAVLLCLLSSAFCLLSTAAAGELTPGTLGMANPAAVYCSELGYRYKVTGGGQGIVTFPDGSTADEWDFYRGKAGKKWSYAALNGYDVKDPAADEGWFKGAVCIDKKTKKAAGTVYDLMKLQAKVAVGTARVFAPPQPPQDRQDVFTAAGSVQSLPTSFDWHNVDGVDWMSPVRNQGGCGACWAFNAVGAVEGQYNISMNDPDYDLDLSEQYLVSCSSVGDCGGGWHATALNFIMSQGVPDEQCFPYKAADSPCSGKCSDWDSRLYKIDSFGQCFPYETEDIKNYLYNVGPLAVALRWADMSFGDGKYGCTVDSPLDHGVVITGWNDTGGYWIIKNSWGATWNGNGYAHIAYDECSIQMHAFGVTLPNGSASATRPSPANAATGVLVGTDLSWLAGADATGHNIYFGTSNPPPFAASQTALVYVPAGSGSDWSSLANMAAYWLDTCLPSGCSGADINGDGTVDMEDFAVLAGRWMSAAGLKPNTTYYWRVDELNGSGTVTGDLWSFTTESPLAKDPMPADGTAELSAAGLSLGWTAPQSAASHNVYFGTVNPPPFAASQTSTQYAVLNTQYGTTYYWRIDEVLCLKSYSGTVWSFSTIGEPNDYITGWWKLDETSGTTASDASGNGHTGTLIAGTAGSLVWSADPNRGAVLKFDGDGPLDNVNPFCRLEVPTAGMSNNKGTICFWANLTDPAPKDKNNRAGVLYFFGLKGSGANDKIKLYVDDPPRMRMNIGDYAYTQAGGYLFSRGQWYHVAIAWSGAAGSGNYVVYVNGTALAPFSGDGKYDNFNSLPAIADVGNKGESTWNQSFHGLMDDIRIYNRALTTEEIAALAVQ